MKAFSDIFKKPKNQLIVYILVPMVIGLISSVVNDLTLVSFINAVFYVAIFTMIFSGFVYVYEKGIFAIVSYSFRKVTILFSRGKLEAYSNSKKATLEDYLKTKKYPFTKPLLHASIILIVLTFILSFVFYE